MKKDSKQTQLTPLENALQTQFKPSANVVREAFKIVEDSRSAFATNAVRFGLCALAAKPIVGHGNFGKWLSDSLADNGNPRPSAERTARDYIGLAKVFVQKLRHPNKLSDALATGVGEFCKFCNIDRDEFDIEKILADKGLTEDLLRRTFAKATGFRDAAQRRAMLPIMRKLAAQKGRLRVVLNALQNAARLAIAAKREITTDDFFDALPTSDATILKTIDNTRKALTCNA